MKIETTTDTVTVVVDRATLKGVPENERAGWWSSLGRLVQSELDHPAPVQEAKRRHRKRTPQEAFDDGRAAEDAIHAPQNARKTYNTPPTPIRPPGERGDPQEERR